MKRKGLIIFLAIVVALGGGVFYAYQNLTTIVRGVVEKEVPRLKFAELDVGMSRVSVTGVEYTSKTNKARLQTKNISIAPSLSSLLTDTLEINDITIDEPQLVARKRPGREGLELPIPEIGGTAEEKQTTAGKEGPAAQATKTAAQQRNVHIAKVRLNRGSGEFIDESVAGAPAQFKFSDVNIAVDNIHIPSKPGMMPLDLKLKLPAKRTGSISLQGKIDRKARSGDLNLNAADLYLPMLSPYYRGKDMNLELADGRISSDTKVTMTEGKYKIKGYVQLADLKVGGGQFYGISASQFQRYLEQHPEPIKIDLELEGDLDQPGSIRRSIIETIAKALVKHVGGARLEGAKQKLQEGDIDGAKQELKDLKRELKNIFKR